MAKEVTKLFIGATVIAKVNLSKTNVLTGEKGIVTKIYEEPSMAIANFAAMDDVLVRFSEVEVINTEESS